MYVQATTLIEKYQILFNSNLAKCSAKIGLHFFREQKREKKTGA